MKTTRFLMMAIVTGMFVLAGCQSSDKKARESELDVKAFQLEVLKKTEANPEANTAHFEIDGKAVSVWRGMTVEQVIERCGQPSDDVSVDVSNVKVLSYKSNSIQLYFTHGILTDYVVLDF